MNAVAIVSGLFVAISIAVLLFFSHKVVWLLRYKQVQRTLIVEAAQGLQSRSQAVLPQWDTFVQSCWRVARASQAGVAGSAVYIRAVEQHLERTVHGVETSRVPIQPLLREALLVNQGARAHTVLQVPIDDEVLGAVLSLDPPPIATPTAPSGDLYELNVRSRYSFWRRALVFVTGLADVVYSSNHMAKMSQYTHVSFGTILRRMSLVLVLVVGIILEVVVGLRKNLEDAIAELLPRFKFYRGLSETVRDNLPSIAALVIWTVVVAIVYFGLFFFIRRKYQQNLKELKRLKDEQHERLAAMRQEHVNALTTWAASYGQTLDAAVDLTARHIALLGRHFAQRARRRIGGQQLLAEAKTISDALFRELPEAAGQLADKVTSKTTSFMHAVWPRRDEMLDVVQQAQYRDAWQYIELMLNELRAGEPIPEEIEGFWRQLVIYASHFSEALPPETLERLRAACLALAEQTSEETERDIAEFGRSSRELVHALNEQLASATPLLAARIDLTNQRLGAATARFEAEVIRARERARLEAMAFEI